MHIASATSKDGSQVFVRDMTSGQLVQRTNAGLHPFLRGQDGMSDIPGARITRPMAESVWVMSAIRRVAGPISSVNLEFSEPGTGVEIAEPLLNSFWEYPAIERSGPQAFADFIEATVGWLKLAGESFWILDDSWLTDRFAKERQPMLVARPDRMKPILEAQRVVGWTFTDAVGKRHVLLVEQVVHLKFWNPYNDLRGLSEYEAAKIATESDYLAGTFALNLMRNNGDQGVIVVAKGGMPSDEQQKQIVAALREKKSQSSRGNFRPIFLTGDVAIEDPKIATPDAQFIAQRLENRHEIYIAFGVPPSMADVTASYSVGSASDRFMLLTETCMPLANGKVAGGIGRVCRMMLPSRTAPVKVRFNFDDHQVMQQVREQKAASAKDFWDRGVSWKVINEYLRLGLPEFPGWDKAYLPFSVAEVGSEEELPKEDAPPVEAPSQEAKAVASMLEVLRTGPVEEMKLLLAAPPAAPRQIGSRVPTHECAFPAASEIAPKADDSKRVKLWKKHMTSRRTAVKRYRAKFSKVLMGARAEVLAKIERHGPELLGKSAVTRATAADFLFDKERFAVQLVSEMRKAGIATLIEAGEQLFAEIGKDDPFTMPPKRVHDFLDARENKLSGVSDDVFDRVRRELKEGVDAGDSTAELSARVRTAFGDIEDGRGDVIAQTEASAAYGYARQDAMDQANIEWKEWLTSGLDTVRSTHLEAEGQRVAVNDPFEIGAAKLFFPGDPSGPPQEVINCHCVSIPVADSGDKAS